jgi:hypothetical protein
VFKKSPPPSPKGLLSDRVRQLGERKPVVPAPPPPSKTNPRPPRQAVFRNATLVTDSGLRLSVAIKDVSDAGARVEFFVKMDLLDVGIVTLIEPMMRLRRRARVAWERDGVAGLAFID